MMDEVRIVVNVEDIIVEESYGGPRLGSIEEINAEWVVKAMEYMKE